LDGISPSRIPQVGAERNRPVSASTVLSRQDSSIRQSDRSVNPTLFTHAVFLSDQSVNGSVQPVNGSVITGSEISGLVVEVHVVVAAAVGAGLIRE
jgi:hypothetical protein